MATPRLLIVPGLHDSGPTHWQSWLQSRHRGAVRVEQPDWSDPHLDRWAACVGATLERAGPGPWVAAAHSFGCLAVARLLALRPDLPLDAVLLVAPAEPDKFGIAGRLPAGGLPVRSVMVISDSDPWMSATSAGAWAQRWGSATVNLGDAGHINAEAGFGPLPLAHRWVQASARRLARRERVGGVVEGRCGSRACGPRLAARGFSGAAAPAAPTARGPAGR